jgi:plasmid maintenance system antidote protein VapI
VERLGIGKLCERHVKMDPKTTCTRDAYAQYMAEMAKMYGMTKEEQVIFQRNLDHEYAQQVRKRLEADDEFWFFLQDSYMQWLEKKRTNEEKNKRVMQWLVEERTNEEKNKSVNK